MKEYIEVTGRIKWELVRNGVVVESGERDNVVTTVGKNGLASLLNSASAGTTWATHMGFGTSTTPVIASDTALGTEVATAGTGYARVAITRSNPSANVIQYQATLTGLTTPQTVQEVGLFDATTTGNLRAHQLTGAVALSTSSDSLQITWQITFN